jgi:acyl-[acyl carrier protein]--UDP-N-acetylglucosamine O-acyltransferase
MLYRSDHNTQRAVTLIGERFPEDAMVRRLTEFVTSSERGIVR